MYMARGPSGRLVIEVDPPLKRDLHSALAADGTTLKDWFLHRLAEYLSERQQPQLPGLIQAQPQPSSNKFTSLNRSL